MTNPSQVVQLQAKVPPELSEKRLDQVLAQLFPEHSRSRFKEWIDGGLVTVNGECRRPKDKVFENDDVLIHATLASVVPWNPESIPLDIVYQDDEILVINKPAGIVVHPGSGNLHGTLVNALLHIIPSLNTLPRAGIVHRLDKDTTGLLVIAKTLTAHTSLITQLQARTVKREYEAVIWGVLPSGGTVNAPIARHPRDRKRMAVVESGKPAITHYRVIHRFKSHTHLRVQLETGRTHQIRVHLAHIQYPIVGDKTYGGRLRVPPMSSAALLEILRSFPRQALHAKRLTLLHPTSGEELSFEAPLPLDMQKLLEGLAI